MSSEDDSSISEWIDRKVKQKKTEIAVTYKANGETWAVYDNGERQILRKDSSCDNDSASC